CAWTVLGSSLVIWYVWDIWTPSMLFTGTTPMLVRRIGGWVRPRPLEANKRNSPHEPVIAPGAWVRDAASALSTGPDGNGAGSSAEPAPAACGESPSPLPVWDFAGGYFRPVSVLR